MKERPILFSTAMVQALLAGRKTQTRRTIKEKFQPIKDEIIRGERMLKPVGWPWLYEREFKSRFCPYGQVGDVLWVREEHYAYGHWAENGKTKSGRQKWKFVRSNDAAFGIYFMNTKPDGLRVKGNNYRGFGWYKRLARFMPRGYCRICLEITDIRVERVQDISEEDAKAEGAIKADFPFDYYSVAFMDLWKRINGAESWEANPWVWVVEFKVLSTTGIPDKL